MKADRTAPAGVFHVITAVWGREYLDLFLNWSIPNQLGEGNMPALPPGSRYRIMTRAADVEEVRHHPMVHALERVIPVDVVAVTAFDAEPRVDARRGDPRFDLLTECHRQAIRDAAQIPAALLFPSPDHVLSAGTFAAIVRRHEEGYRAVLSSGVRLEKESFLQAATESGLPFGAPPPRELVRLALPHLHAHTRSMFAEAEAFNSFPQSVCWPVGRSGLLAHCLHLHPLMLDPLRRDAMPKGTIDGGYAARACPDPTRVHVVTDSDECAMFELTEAGRSDDARGRLAAGANRQALVDIGATVSRTAGAAAWRTAAVAARCNDFELECFRRRPIRIHADALDSRWAPVESAADGFVRRVTWRLGPFGVRSPRWYMCVERVRQLHDRQRRAWRKRRPRIRLKQMLRPARIATDRIGRNLRKTTRRLFRQVVTAFR